MKKKTTYVLLAMIIAAATIFYNAGNKEDVKTSQLYLRIDKTSSVIELSDSLPDEFTFVFSTAGGKMFIMADARSAQNMSDVLVKEKNIKLADLGVGNAFFIKSENGPFLCTAKHCAQGLEEYSANIGSDIAFVDYKRLPKSLTANNFDLDANTGYPNNPTFEDNDSLVIKGFLPGSDGKIRHVVIRGTAVKIDKKDLPKESSEFKYAGLEYMQNITLVMKMDHIVDLGGLSGSPAFNAKGEVVGVFSGRTLFITGNDTTCHIRVSMLVKSE